MANIVDTNLKNTTDKAVGLLADGIELYSPSLFNEKIYYGSISNVKIINEGEDYDIITPPNISVLDIEGFGEGAIVHGNLKGKIKEVLVISPGVGFDKKPNLNIIGGNIKGSIVLDTNFIKKQLTAKFIPYSNGVGSTTINFVGPHNFEEGEEVIYNSEGFPNVVGLTSYSTYYAGIVDSNTISLYATQSDALERINVISGLTTIVGLNTGVQSFSTKNVKNVVDSIYIEDNSGILSHKIVRIDSKSITEISEENGINVADGYIYAKNHNFEDKDLIVYEYTIASLGISTTNQYFVKTIDENKFKLADAGSNYFPDDTNYNEETYITFTGIGSGHHTFKYPPIQIIFSYETASNLVKIPEVKPVVLGSFDSIFIENSGVGYGVSEIVNIQKNPITTINSNGYTDTEDFREAVLRPIIINGEIVDVVILNSGNNYEENVDIQVDGVGKYAKLLPNIVNGKLVKVDVISTGEGYANNSTFLSVKKRGKNAKFLTEITSWTIDQYFKNKAEVDSNSGNGYIIPSKNIKNTLQFINFYPSSNLRTILNDNPTSILSKSPILGWAYDGNPIFGPYLGKNDQNQLEIAKSSYKLDPSLNKLTTELKRPPFNPGYFIEDYKYDESLSDLDEHYGMFVYDRDEFPSGTYGYFMSLDDNLSPKYPYVVGPTFKNAANSNNYNYSFNQNLDLEGYSYIRNTNPLYLISGTSKYLPIQTVQDKYNQKYTVKNVLASDINSFEIISEGTGYKVGDRLNFTLENSQDISPNSVVSKITGKPLLEVSVGISTFYDVKFKTSNNKIIGITSSPHYLKDNHFIHISGSTNSLLDGDYKIKVNNKTVTLLTNMEATGLTTTTIQVNDISGFEPGDYIKIDGENAKVIEIHPSQTTLLIQRIDNLGIHTSGLSSVSILPTKFSFENIEISSTLSLDNKHYFNPRTSVGLGTTGTIVNDYNNNSSYFIPAKNIFIPDHNYKNNQVLRYSTENISEGLLVSDSNTSTTYRLFDGQSVYAFNYGVNLLGISTVAYAQTSLTFREGSYSFDEVHSFEYIDSIINGKVESFNLNLITSDEHSLVNGNFIELKGKEDTWEYYVVRFDMNQPYDVEVVNSNQFTINLSRYPQFITKTTDLDALNISYITDSKNTEGGIANIETYYSSNFYKELPVVSNITSDNGSGAIIIPLSNKIGRIDSIQRIKDGFDFPSDVTLQPKLSTNTFCYLQNINKVERVDVLFGGVSYNTIPTLKVLGNSEIKLTAVLTNSKVSKVIVENSPNNLNDALDIIPINNSNGFDILSISKVSSNINRIIVDINQFPLIYSDYSSPTVNFPFQIGDFIFIENCRIDPEESNTVNYNSSEFSYSFFEVIDVDSSTGKIDYSTQNIPSTLKNFGTYINVSGYGSVVNSNRMAKFKMIMGKNNYTNSETVNVFDTNGNIKFTGQVLRDTGWNPLQNLLRITRSLGTLEVGDVVLGTTSNMKGKVVYLNSFTMSSKFGPTRDKINYDTSITDLNNSFKRIQDSNYYQNFSYSIRGNTPYEVWKEPVKSILHPSGFVEFSDLQIVSEAVNKLQVKTDSISINLEIKIENENSFFTRKNFNIAYEDPEKDYIENSSAIERIYMGSGTVLWPVAKGIESNINFVPYPGYGTSLALANGLTLLPYILNKSNNVIPIKDISSQFTGNSDLIILGTYLVNFNSSTPNTLGINTNGLEVGDIIGYSQYHENPYNTRILSIGINSVTTLYPHKLLSSSLTQSLDIYRNLNHNSRVGITSFRLVANDDSNIFKINAYAQDIDVSTDSIKVPHKFESGQIVHYKNVNGSPISIASTDQVIGGITTTILPEKLYITKISDTEFKLSGLSNQSNLDLVSVGSGTHQFIFDNPNASAIIKIDNIIQTPIHLRPIQLELSGNVGISTDILYVNSGITSITSFDILKINDEFLKVSSVGISSENSIEIERGFLGTTPTSHLSLSTIFVYRGNYSITEDIIYFTSPPFGPAGLPGLEISSKFSGRVFSRTFSESRPNDTNLVMDDIADNFIGSQEFILKSNGQNVVGLYTNTNNPDFVDINNNPIILINNIPQVTNVDFDITTENQNRIIFLSGTPKSGKVLSFETEPSFGYMPLVGAAATISLGVGGSVSNVYLTGPGAGYRSAPNVDIISNIGTGASVTASIDVNGYVTSLTILNGGEGYDDSSFIIIDEPLPYYDLDLTYDSSSSGIGSQAKVSVKIGEDSTVQRIEFTEPGQNYKVGDVLNVVGLVTDTSVGNSFIPLKIKVKEVLSDSFGGIYPGQFIQLDDISPRFNSVRKSFDLYTTINGDKSRLTIKSRTTQIRIENNFFVFINDILQDPIEAYQYSSGRLTFTEAPKEDSRCNILYYLGSSDDIELIVPRQTLKDGDQIKFENSELSDLDSEQMERVIRRIIDSGTLDTFPYSGFGIDPYVRPFTWTKQKRDRIISGSLIPKGRNEQKSRIYPTANLISNLSSTGTYFYVDNAYPLFIELDNNVGGIIEEKRNVRLIARDTFQIAELSATVSASSTITNIAITNPGSGYDDNSVVTISSPGSSYKDPVYVFSNTILSLSSSNFNSYTYGNAIVAVGEDNLIGISTNTTTWTLDDISSLGTLNLKRVNNSTNNSYVAVGEDGKIIFKQNLNTSWQLADLKKPILGPLDQILGIEASDYSGTFNDVVYNSTLSAWIAVGESGKIYTSSDSINFIERKSQIYNYKSVAFNSSVSIALGDSGLSRSTDSVNWFPIPGFTSSNVYYSVTWDENRFIVTSDNGIYVSDFTATSWTLLNGSPNNIKKIIKYNKIYIGLDFLGNVYTSLNLIVWYKRILPNIETINDIGLYPSISGSYPVYVGNVGTFFYSIPTINKASATCTITNGSISSVQLINEGFGYVTSSDAKILVSQPYPKTERIFSIKAKGDFGKIVGIETSNTGVGTNTPSIKFELLSDYSESGYESLNTFGITYSQLQIGDYFIITNSNVYSPAGYAVTGITTSLGGMANYPESRVGTATTYLDGVYRVEYVQSTTQPQGIVTVTCHVYPVDGKINLNTDIISNNYYGNYSWSKIYDYNNRSIGIPLDFTVNTNNGLIGISTSPTVVRIPPLLY